MTDSEWTAWVSRHASIYQMTRQEDKAMFAQWRREFEAMGFTGAELHAATDHITREAKGVTRWEHLEAIRDFIRSARRHESAKKRVPRVDDKPDRGTCVLCFDSGWVSGLPHLSQVTYQGWLPLVDGSTPIVVSVVCTCICGRWILEAFDARDGETKKRLRRPMTLVQYTSLNACWKQQMRDLDERRKLEQSVNATTRHADTFGALNIKAALERIVSRSAMASKS